jgi:hypothetical protein
MKFPLSISDMGLWLAAMAIILLITSELLSSTSTYSRNIMIDRRLFRWVALTLGIGFMTTVVMRVFQTI